MTEVSGPIDYLVLEIPERSSVAATAEALTDLVDRGVVALYDLMMVRKSSDGTSHEVDLAREAPADLTAFAGARSGLFGDEDVTEASNALAPGTSALVILYENRWAVPFAAAARNDGIELVASARLSAQAVMDTLDDLETTV